MVRLNCSIFFFLLSLIPVLTEAAAINSLKTFIQETRTVRAKFSQTLYDKNSRAIQESTGTMQFERPEKFRWAYEEPYEQLIVGNGTQVWFYDHDLNQVTIRQFSIAIGSSPAALLAGSSTIEDNFELVELGMQNEMEWLEATPKSKESAFEFIQMGFSPEGALKIMALRDNFGQTTLLSFSELDKNPTLPPDLFKFIPPDNADVITE
ncbi:outer membrane lipoprotein chaperone LolA [Nitrosomonas ureae]|uniref:Outer-membrane lipoprotein carrier protein n=1 Tax=Nitrosomonas ureae TaxID=44577 RepID=A0A0S3AKR9_9PROT|nr:outer membrane lipoprotein chaperone LolA [Nitrosomonas ureae]ALQ51756.1 outer membrane lipoprotein carrier protein LolA [Nitrosomonas ureae]PTQ85834.1 outer membrane lipoprotein carrier protein [Nitrosomonas ureae]PXX12376.1 outer membrane lipoprotein carrier protein [Nitrosomonas ureae]SDU01201.1 outer membrane lipoprotein carrier protein [Nitrosomonas ureae]SEP71380.1 outer membrane lipoprotein carrier protein [Nitrosomonas ureae]